MEEEVRGMELQDARRYRELERENGELKKIVADQMLKIECWRK